MKDITLPRVASACGFLACAAFLALGPVRAAKAAETNSIDDVFYHFETICLTYAEEGYSIGVRASIDRAGFEFVGENADGEDGFTMGLVQLIIGRKGCAFGMANLPFEQMLRWTETWAMLYGMTISTPFEETSGNHQIWSGDGFLLVLEQDEFPDGTPLTGLVLEREE